MFIKIVKSIFNKKIISIIIIFQLIQLFNSFFEIKDIYTKYDVFDNNMNELNIDSTKINLFEVKNSSLNNNLVNNFANFKDEVFRSGYNLGNTTKNSFEFEKFNDVALQEKQQQLYYKYRTDFEFLQVDSLSIILVDYAILEMLNLQIVDGINLSINDYRDYTDEESIPIVLSEEYKGYFKLHEELYHEFGNRNYKVVGFYRNDAKWLNPVSPLMGKYDSLANNAIMPLVKNDEFSPLNIQEQVYSGLLGQINSPKEKEEILKIAAKYNIDLSITQLKEIDQTIKTNLGNSVKSIVVFFVLLFIVVCISISSILIYMINDRKYYLGIERVNGATNSYLSKLVIYELIFLFLIALIISVFFRYSNVIDVRIQYIFNEYLIGIILSTIMITIISIIPLKSLTKKSIVQLLR